MVTEIKRQHFLFLVSLHVLKITKIKIINTFELIKIYLKKDLDKNKYKKWQKQKWKI